MRRVGRVAVLTLGILAAARPGQTAQNTGTGERDASPPTPWGLKVTANAQAPADSPRVTFRFRNRPSLRIGDVFRLDLRVKIHGDVRGFRPVLDPAAPRVRFTRRRVGLEGTVADWLDYQVERELDPDQRWPWRDVFVNLRVHRAVGVQAGKFKMPFSLEQLTSATDLDFVHRSRAAATLAPGRARGVMVHGRVGGRALFYEVGWFDREGELARHAGHAAGRPTWAVRVLTGAGVRALRVGGAVTTAELPEGLNGLKGESIGGYDFFEPVYVAGRRQRLGIEASWTPGPVSVKAEALEVIDERKRQGLSDEDLPPAIARGWYVSGTWLVTGEPKNGNVEPRRPFPHRGFGAIELAARVEQLLFGSRRAADPTEPFFANPRAANLVRNRVRAATVGVNWFLNRWVRLQLNGTREAFQDPERTPLPGRRQFWSWVLRLQAVL